MLKMKKCNYFAPHVNLWVTLCKIVKSKPHADHPKTMMKLCISHYRGSIVPNVTNKGESVVVDDKFAQDVDPTLSESPKHPSNPTWSSMIGLRLKIIISQNLCMKIFW